MDVVIDCDTCAVRGAACGDCVVTVMLGLPDAPGASPEVVPEEREALEVLAGAGLVPRLRMVSGSGRRSRFDHDAMTESCPSRLPRGAACR